MILGRRERRRVRFLEEVAAMRLRVLLDGEEFVNLTAESMAQIARWSGAGEDRFVDLVRLPEATKLEIEYSLPTTP